MNESSSDETIEQMVLASAKELLDRDDLTLDDDFFDVGGDSLIGMHFIGRVGRGTNRPVRMTLLFAHPVLGEFAARVAQLAVRPGDASEGFDAASFLGDTA